jgi:hypothetical protein
VCVYIKAGVGFDAAKRQNGGIDGHGVQWLAHLVIPRVRTTVMFVSLSVSHRLAGFLVASRPKEENPGLWVINSWEQLISQVDKFRLNLSTMVQL